MILQQLPTHVLKYYVAIISSITCFCFLEPVSVSVTKSHFVYSILECAHLCQVESTCKAFRHRNVEDNVNCQITVGVWEHSTVSENNAKEKWIFYALEPVRNYFVPHYYTGRASKLYALKLGEKKRTL